MPLQVLTAFEEEAAQTAEFLTQDIPADEIIELPPYYIDSYTDFENPIYFEQDVPYVIRYNQFSDTRFCRVGHRLIIFNVVNDAEGDMLEKVADINLMEQRFSFADIFTPQILTEVVRLNPHMDLDMLVKLLDINELLDIAGMTLSRDSETRMETILAHVFGAPRYSHAHAWGWFVPDCDYGIEIYDNMGTRVVQAIDQEMLLARTSKQSRKPKDTAGEAQEMLAGWELLLES